MADSVSSSHEAGSSREAGSSHDPAPSADAAAVEGGVVLEIAALVEEHHAVVYRYAYRLTGSAADAEDLTQQTFLTAQMKLHQLRDRSHARAWLFAILRRWYLRTVRCRAPVPACAVELDMNGVPQAAPYETWVDQEKLQAAINELDDEFKLVVLLFYFEQCSYREIADQLSLPVGTVMSRLSRAKKHLSSRLVEYRPRPALVTHAASHEQGT